MSANPRRIRRVNGDNRRPRPGTQADVRVTVYPRPPCVAVPTSLRLQPLARRARRARRERGRHGASELGRRAGELSAVSGGCQRSLTKRVLACEQFAVEMPFSSILAAAAGATERMRGCTVSRKIALLALSIYVHRGVGRRRLALALGTSHCDCVL